MNAIISRLSVIDSEIDTMVQWKLVRVAGLVINIYKVAVHTKEKLIFYLLIETDFSDFM